MFFPHMQEARLLDDQDPNAILEATGAPVSNPPAPLGVGAPQAQMSPYGPPTAPQGMFNYTPDPSLQNKANIMGMFSNINRVAGGAGLVNPFQQQIAQNQELAMKRYQALQKAQQDNPFHAYEQAKARKYFKLGEGETDEQGLRRFTQEQFKDPSQSVYGQKMDDLSALMGGDRGAASKLANGLLEVRTDPYGGQGVYDLSNNEFTTAYSPDQIASGKALIAGAEGQATGKAANDWDVVKQVETSLSTLADEWEASNAGVMRGREALALLEGGEVEPGLVAGTVLDYLGIGSSKLAYYQNLSQQQLFEELGSATLTPVSDADIRALSKLFTSASQSPEVAKGNLEAFLARKEREQERKSGRMRREIKRINDADYRQGLTETYQPFIDFKAISSWDNVPDKGAQ